MFPRPVLMQEGISFPVSPTAHCKKTALHFPSSLLNLMYTLLEPQKPQCVVSVLTVLCGGCSNVTAMVTLSALLALVN